MENWLSNSSSKSWRISKMKLNVRNLKMMVIASFSVLVVLAFIFADSAVTITHAEIPGAPSRRTGAPGETTCTGCHQVNTQTGQSTIVAPATYVPGQTYTIQIQSTSTDLSRLSWGFEMTSLTAGGLAAGTYAHTTAFTQTKTGTVTGFGVRNYATHTTSGIFAAQANGATWTFSWTAPATDVGPITHYAAMLHGDNGADDTGDQTYVRTAVSNPGTVVVIHHGFSDFDGDGKADASVFRPTTGVWYINRSTQGFTAIQLGLATDKMTPADFDGDDKTDFAVWREAPAAQAAFYILQSSNSTLRIEVLGQTGDLSLPVGDWDGDGKADPAVYRNSAVGSQSYFYYRGSLSNPGGNITYVPWGTTGDKPMRGDFDGDGKADATVFRTSNQTWYIRQSSNNQLRLDNWGLGTDKFVPADYDGDGKTDPAVFRSGVWYVKQSLTGLPAFYNWGLNTDTLVPGDYDADGKTDPAVNRGGIWYIRLSGTGAMSAQTFGVASDTPVPSAFVQ